MSLGSTVLVIVENPLPPVKSDNFIIPLDPVTS